MSISRQLTEARGRAPFFAPPKTAAGRRRVVVPGTVIAEVQEHLDNYTAAGGDALVFTSPSGRLLRHSNFQRAVPGTGPRPSPASAASTFTTSGTPATTSSLGQEPTSAS